MQTELELYDSFEEKTTAYETLVCYIFLPTKRTEILDSINLTFHLLSRSTEQAQC